MSSSIGIQPYDHVERHSAAGPRQRAYHRPRRAANWLGDNSFDTRQYPAQYC
jgi:hypothetical protein